jgi:serine/threonine-protein kinase
MASSNEEPLSQQNPTPDLVNIGGIRTAAFEAPTLPADHKPATELGRPYRSFADYELVEVIAHGGMGVVYKARQVSLNRNVALKMIRSGELASSTERERFRREAEAAANLNHPDIVSIFEVGERDGQCYFSMQLIEGGSLAQKMDEFGLPSNDSKSGRRAPSSQWPMEAIKERMARIAELLAQVALAVHHAHEHGVLHRDLKPGNILIDAQGRPHVTDFGLAKRSQTDESLTQSGVIVGTPSYMSPEQADCKRGTPGAASDVYSLGAVLYELLTGRPPFRAETPVDTILQVLEQEPQRVRALNRAVDRNLESICLKCLEKEPQKRYHAARDLAEDLKRYREGDPIAARPAGPVGSLARWARRRPALAATVAGISIFYVNYVVLLMLGLSNEQMSYLWSVSGLSACWIASATMFQALGSRPSWRTPAVYGWAAMDVVLFSTLLLISDGPRSALLMGYFLLIAGAALRFRLVLVWFVAILCALSYTSLCVAARWRYPELAVDLRTCLIFNLGILLMGLIVYLTLVRSRRATSKDW